MLLIKNNKIITIAFILSISIHLILLLYSSNKPVIEEQIVYFEIVRQQANTDVTKQETNIEKTQEQEEKKEVVKKAEIPKKIIKKKETVKKTIKKQDTIKSEGKEQINNQAEMYIKQNYTNIHNQIIGNIIYPPRAKKLGIEGSGYLLILIDKEGSIISIKAFDFPNQLLSDAAIKAAKKASKSATHQLSSNVEIKIPVTFKLQ